MKSVAFVCLLGGVALADAGSSQIIGGTKTALGDFPTVVVLEVGQGLCTGTLISPTFVLTAGHCIDPASVGASSDATLLAGLKVHFDTVNVIASKGTVITAKRVIKAGFNANAIGQHDIGLIELATAVTDREPSRVNIDASKAPASSTVGTMVGYGTTSGASQSAGVEYVLNNRTSGKCDEVIVGGGGIVSDANLLCFAQVDDKGKCHGDSGGPTFATVDGVQMIVGVTSFGDQNCQAFGADTRTDIEMDFLLTNVPDLCTAADCTGEGGGSDGGCCDASGRGAPTSVLGFGVIALAIRRRRR